MHAGKAGGDSWDGTYLRLLVTRMAIIVTQTFIPMLYNSVICRTIEFAEDAQRE